MTEVQIRAKIVKAAISHVGEHEVGSTNDNAFGREFNYNFVAWCMIYVSLMYGRVGIKLAAPGHYNAKGFASVPAFWDAYKTQATKDPQPGDAVIFDWTKKNSPKHVGIFLLWLDRAAGEFMTVEGNTVRVGDQSNGGNVMVREDRNMDFLIGFVSITQFIKSLPL